MIEIKVKEKVISIKISQVIAKDVPFEWLKKKF